MTYGVRWPPRALILLTIDPDGHSGQHNVANRSRKASPAVFSHPVHRSSEQGGEQIQAENLIKLHKGQLASDRTSCRSALANQVRLVLHTAAYWLMLTVRDAIPKPQPLAAAEFNTPRMRLLKIAARVTETATRVRIAFAAACPEAELFRGVARSLQLARP